MKARSVQYWKTSWNYIEQKNEPENMLKQRVVRSRRRWQSFTFLNNQLFNWDFNQINVWWSLVVLQAVPHSRTPVSTTLHIAPPRLPVQAPTLWDLCLLK